MGDFLKGGRENLRKFLINEGFPKELRIAVDQKQRIFGLFPVLRLPAYRADTFMRITLFRADCQYYFSYLQILFFRVLILLEV